MSVDQTRRWPSPVAGLDVALEADRARAVARRAQLRLKAREVRPAGAPRELVQQLGAAARRALPRARSCGLSQPAQDGGVAGADRRRRPARSDAPASTSESAWPISARRVAPARAGPRLPARLTQRATVSARAPTANAGPWQRLALGDQRQRALDLLVACSAVATGGALAGRAHAAARSRSSSRSSTTTAGIAALARREPLGQRHARRRATVASARVGEHAV